MLFISIETVSYIQVSIVWLKNKFIKIKFLFNNVASN